MPRLPYRLKTELPEAYQEVLRRDVNLYKALAHSPALTQKFAEFGLYLRNKPEIDPRLREMAIVRTAHLAKSRYAYAHHVKIGLACGMTEADLAAAIDEIADPSRLDEPAVLVLRVADEMTREGGVSQSTFDALERVFSREVLTDLIVTIGWFNAVVRILASLEVDLEPGLAQEALSYPGLPPA